MGLQAIKRKTPQELSGRRKRVLDKPFAPDSNQLKKQKETIVNEQVMQYLFKKNKDSIFCFGVFRRVSLTLVGVIDIV